MSRARWIEHRCLPKFQRINAKTPQISLQCRKRRNMSLYFLQTPVTMMPKLHKDKRRENCRPISFIKMSAKFLTKIYRKWIKEHTQISIIHLDQVDFIPELHAWLNFYKSLNVIKHMNKMKDRKHMVISLNEDRP